MNNNQFRALFLDKPSSNGEATSASHPPPKTAATLSSKRLSLGSRPSRPGTSFAQTAREQYGAFQSRSSKPPAKKFKSSAPKGSKFGAGYVDRAKARATAEEDQNGNDKERRIRALEEQVQLGNLSRDSFEALRDEITNGDVGSTHLVKGLDRKLLERVRAGEDVLGLKEGDADGTASTQDVDTALEDALVQAEPATVSHDKQRSEKKGVTAAAAAAAEGSIPSMLAGKKRTRDEIMAELKAQRQAAAAARAEAEKSVLDARWTRVGGPDAKQQPKHRIEIDSKGREVLITVDEDGVVKRKVRKMAAPEEQSSHAGSKVVGVDVLDVKRPVLGADAFVPVLGNEETKVGGGEEEDDDIFAGAGTEYNPLGDEEDDHSDDEEQEKAISANTQPPTDDTPISPVHDTLHPRRSDHLNSPPTEDLEIGADSGKSPPAESPQGPTSAPSRNYFSEAKASNAPDQDPSSASSMRIQSLQQILHKAAVLADKRPHPENDDEIDDQNPNADVQARLKRRAALLSQQDRDWEDMDVGFGASRFDDEGGEDDDGEGRGPKLSEWKGLNADDDDDDGPGEKSNGKKKPAGRRPRKRKGDKNSMRDVLGVIERRKGEGKGKDP